MELLHLKVHLHLCSNHSRDWEVGALLDRWQILLEIL
nr:MAG TPA: hypothetical protein [Bacteriophage sp.]